MMARRKTMAIDETLTVGGLRKLIADLPDEALIFPDWAHGPPHNEAPAVEVLGFALEQKQNTADGKPYLSVQVDVVYLEDMENLERSTDRDDDDEEDDDG
jgi:hypothetical protein